MVEKYATSVVVSLKQYIAENFESQAEFADR